MLTNATFDGNTALSGGETQNDTSNPGLYNTFSGTIRLPTLIRTYTIQAVLYV